MLRLTKRSRKRDVDLTFKRASEVTLSKNGLSIKPEDDRGVVMIISSGGKEAAIDLEALFAAMPSKEELAKIPTAVELDEDTGVPESDHSHGNFRMAVFDPHVDVCWFDDQRFSIEINHAGEEYLEGPLIQIHAESEVDLNGIYVNGVTVLVDGQIAELSYLRIVQPTESYDSQIDVTIKLKDDSVVYEEGHVMEIYLDLRKA